MHFVGFWVVWHVVARIGRAFKVIWLLLSDRELVLAMPWRAMRDRIRRNRWLLLKSVALVSVVVGLPLSAVVPGGFEVAPMIGWLWAAALFVPWLMQRVRV